MTATIHKLTAPDGTEFAIYDVTSLYYVQHKVIVTTPAQYTALTAFEPIDPAAPAWRLSVFRPGQPIHLNNVPEVTGRTFTDFWNLLAGSWNLTYSKESSA